VEAGGECYSVRGRVRGRGSGYAARHRTDGGHGSRNGRAIAVALESQSERIAACECALRVERWGRWRQEVPLALLLLLRRGVDHCHQLG
jgi:hypothetical protein